VDPFSRVLREPGSLSARRALAEHWRSTGDLRAELFEKQQLLTELTARSDPRARLVEREVDALIASHGRTWAGRVGELVEKFEFRRGLVAQVSVSGERFPVIAAELFAEAPIQHLNLIAPLGDLARVFSTPAFERLVSLECVRHEAAFGDEGARLLAQSPRARGLRWIDLMSNAIGEAGAEALAASPYLREAVLISVERNPANFTPYSGDYGAEVWMRAGGRPALASSLDARFGPLPWLAIPSGDWPPRRDDLAITA
jgi:hypothetical protein